MKTKKELEAENLDFQLGYNRARIDVSELIDKMAKGIYTEFIRVDELKSKIIEK